ncbi:hypothetical protein KEM60_03015 [Austwickia sp. TVS 96-490-7B]|nr:hypothetical protein [Austwickia sp. TVS 96-490-7B]
MICVAELLGVQCPPGPPQPPHRTGKTKSQAWLNGSAHLIDPVWCHRCHVHAASITPLWTPPDTDRGCGRCDCIQG